MRKLLLFLCVTGFQWLAAQTGFNWGQPMDVPSISGTGFYHPRVELDGQGNPLVIWGNGSNNGVYFARWNGAAFAAPSMLNVAPAFVASWEGPSITAQGDSVYVVFKTTPIGMDTSHIYCLHSYDGGATFSAPVQVEHVADSISEYPAVTTDAIGNPVISFMKLDPNFGRPRHVVCRSTDGGLTFSQDIKVSGLSGGSICDCCPAVPISRGNDMAILFRSKDSDIRNINATISHDGCATLAGDMNIDGSNWLSIFCPASGPDGVIIGDSLYAVYMSGASGTNKAYFSRSSILSRQSMMGSLIADFQLPVTAQNYPRIAAQGNTAAWGWVQERDTLSELDLMMTTDITQGFAGGYEVAVADHVANFDLAMRDGKVWLVWQDTQLQTVRAMMGTYTATSTPQPSVAPEAAIFPNPVQNGLVLSLPAGNSYQAAILDVNGRPVQENNGLRLIDRSELSVSELPAGLYFLRLTDSKGRMTMLRFVKAG